MVNIVFGLPEDFLYVGKVVGLEISEDSTCVLNVWHSLKVQRLVNGSTPFVNLSFLCYPKKQKRESFLHSYIGSRFMLTQAS